MIPYKWMKERRDRQQIEILKSQKEPEIYNQEGQRKRVFYLKDTLSQHTPYTLVLGQEPKEVLWDRNNVGLPIQFFTHEYITTETSPYCVKKYAILFESEVIRPQDFELVMTMDKGRIAEYNKIFTFSERVLDRYSNAAFLPASGLWYGTEINGGVIDEKLYEQKDKNVSVVASNKTFGKYHQLRVKIANDAIRTGLVDGYGRFCGNYIEKKADALQNYRYSIVVENDVNSYYFTEKLLDCFASMTVPIYLGATKIEEYFNVDGMIILHEEECDNLEKILKQCSEQDYLSRLDAIRDNFERVQQYRCIEDYMMINYRKEFEI